MKRASLLRLLLACAGTSCLIADPGTDPPKPVPTRPQILRESVVPSPNNVLGAFPAKFVIPVQLSDPTLSFDYAVFVDYDPSTSLGKVDCGTKGVEAASLSGAPRILEVTIEEAPDPDRCHVIEVLVALHLLCDFDANSAHAAPAPGADSVTWFYSPTGDLAGCPVLDAGLEASRPDDSGLPP
ncbi:MAG TPA: hypothetical protein VIF62_11830 [Labilithrix sp.]|jgi:hypothetical protein